MIKILLICVGKLKESYYREAVAEYERRLSYFCDFSVCEIDPIRLSDHPYKAEIDAALIAEATRIASKIPHGALVTALCIEGEQLDATEIGDIIYQKSASGCGSFVFIIGGSHGLAPSVKERAGLKLSMSVMTFPHRLARIMLTEQLYRAFCIKNNVSYNK